MASGTPPLVINVYSNVGQAQAGLNSVAQSIGRVDAAAARTRLAIGGMMHNFNNIAVGVAAITAVYKAFSLLNATIAKTVAVNTEFEQMMQHVKAVSEQNVGFTIDLFKEMRAEARRLGATTRFTATQAAEGLKFLSMAGFDARQSTQALEGTLRLAQAGNLELGRAADIVTNILTAFGEQADQTGRFVDVLAAAAANANTDIEMLAMGMKFVAPVASGLGLELEETTAAMMALSNAGLQSAMSGTGLRMLLTSLGKESGRTVKEFKKLGIAFEEIDPTRNSIVEILEAIAAKTQGPAGAAKIMGAFTARSSAAALVLTKLVKDVDGFEKMLLKANGAAEKMATTMDDSLQGSAKGVASAWEEMLLQIGDGGVLEVLRQIVVETRNWLMEMNASGDVGEIGRDIADGLMQAWEAMKRVGSLIGGIISAFYKFRTVIMGVIAAIVLMKTYDKIAGTAFISMMNQRTRSVKRMQASVRTAARSMKASMLTMTNAVGVAIIGLTYLIDRQMQKAEDRMASARAMMSRGLDMAEFMDGFNEQLGSVASADPRIRKMLKDRGMDLPDPGEVTFGKVRTEEDFAMLAEGLEMRRKALERLAEEVSSDSELKEDAQKEQLDQIDNFILLLDRAEDRMHRNKAAILAAAKAQDDLVAKAALFTENLEKSVKAAERLRDKFIDFQDDIAVDALEFDPGEDGSLEKYEDSLLALRGIAGDFLDLQAELQQLQKRSELSEGFEGLKGDDLTMAIQRQIALDKGINMDDVTQDMVDAYAQNLISDEDMARAELLMETFKMIKDARKEAANAEAEKGEDKANAEREYRDALRLAKARLTGDEAAIKAEERKQAIAKKTAELEAKGVENALAKAEALVDAQMAVEAMNNQEAPKFSPGAAAGAINTIMGRTTEAQIAAETMKTRRAAEKTAEEAKKNREATEKVRDYLASEGRFR